jgi:uncharacterized membrane protein YbhN (UPF0104 family)
MDAESLSVARGSGARITGSRAFWMLAGLVISVGLAWYLLRKVDLNEFVRLAQNVPAWRLVLAFALYVLLNFWRSLRFRVFLDRHKSPIRALFPITLYHNFLVRTLPFRTGELAYITLLRQYLHQPVSDGFSSLLGARLFELLLVIMGGLAGLLLSSSQLVEQGQLILTFLIGGFVACLGIIYWAGRLTRILTRWWHWAIGRTPWQTHKLAGAIEQKLQAIAIQLDRMNEPRVFASMLLFSICTYSTNAIYYIVVMNALGLNAPIGILLPVISLGMLASFFPLSFLELGVVESGFTFGMVVLAGLEIGQAVPLAFFLHGFQMICAALTGLIGYLMLQLTAQVDGRI